MSAALNERSAKAPKRRAAVLTKKHTTATQANGTSRGVPRLSAMVRPRRVDLLKARRGKLEVIGIARVVKYKRDRITYWRVRCSCGVEEELTGRDFQKRQGCRRCEHVERFFRTIMLRPEQQFSVTGFSHYRPSKTGGQGQFIWDCLCQCGNTFKVESKHLKDPVSCPKCSLERVGKRARGRPSPCRKHIPSRKVISVLRQAYAYRGADAKKASDAPTLRKIAKATGYSTAALRDLASELGLSGTVSRPQRAWEENEVGMLMRLRGCSRGYIKSKLHVAGFTRSRNQIRNKLREIEFYEHGMSYSVTEVAQLLGYESEEKVCALARAGTLRPEKKKWTRTVPPKFSRAELRRFLLEQPESYSLGVVDRVAFVLLVLKDGITENAAAQPKESLRRGVSTEDVLVETLLRKAGEQHSAPASYTQWTREEALGGLRYLHGIYGAAPSYAIHYIYLYRLEYARRPPRRLPSMDVIRRFWANVRDAWLEAGITPSYRLDGLQVGYEITERVDRQIKDVCTKHRQRAGRLHALGQIGKTVRIPTEALALRAAQIGLREQASPNWTREELDILERVSHLSKQTIARTLTEAGCERSWQAARIIKARAASLHAELPFHYSMQQVAYRFGLDAHCIRRWLAEGWLRYEMKGTARTKQQGGDTRVISLESIVQFVRQYPELVDLRKVNQAWFLAALRTGRTDAGVIIGNVR